jgi:hypothetical protein
MGALEEVERVNHVCGHVLLALVGPTRWGQLDWPRKAYAGSASKPCESCCRGRPFEGDVAVYFAGLPSLPEPELLERMRRKRPAPARHSRSTSR